MFILQEPQNYNVSDRLAITKLRTSAQHRPGRWHSENEKLA